MSSFLLTEKVVLRPMPESSVLVDYIPPPQEATLEMYMLSVAVVGQVALAHRPVFTNVYP